ncbi:MAG: plasmid pRiA4b ORF-3 family protein, partial [Deltaproteobacteria bacterium]|nr:plasmid pRiA4b ORF-3 family protein [Deltaproteobacteria bacterium]
MIWILKVELLFGAYAEEEWEGTIEIESSSTLEDLHFALQDILNFDNDHMYEFYVSRTERSRDRIRYDDENGLVYDLTLEKLYPLGKNRKLFYLFDYGDHWLFKVTKSRK